MFFPDRIVFSDFMLTWKKNIFIYKNVTLSENPENHRYVGLKILLPRQCRRKSVEGAVT